MSRYVYFLLSLALAGMLSALAFEEGRMRQQAGDVVDLAMLQQFDFSACRSAYLRENEIDLYGFGVSSRNAEVAALQAKIDALLRERWILKQKAAWMEPYERCENGKCLAVVEVTK
jgi:hypothetical protein